MSKQNLLSVISVIAVLLSGGRGTSAAIVGGSCLVPDQRHACWLSVGPGEESWAGSCNGQPVQQSARMSVIAEARAREERLQLCPQATSIEQPADIVPGRR
jgi:hypothetical protein